MNCYLLRSLVAISTFLLGIAVNAVIHPFEIRHREQTNLTYVYREQHCPREMVKTPSLSIDAAATDPVKLVYSQTNPRPNSNNQQVILLLDNQTTRPIRTAAIVKYSSQLPINPADENGSVRASYYASSITTSAQDLDTVSIDCGSNETLFLWISSVEFKDGSRWINPRHQSDQGIK